MTPTARTLHECRQRGWIADVTERWIGKAPFAKRKDLFGFIDVLAIDTTTNQLVAIQCTSGSNCSARISKILHECETASLALAKAGVRLEVWAWKKYARKVARRSWRVRVEVIAVLGAASGPHVLSADGSRPRDQLD